jgi:hypothetical protein
VTTYREAITIVLDLCQVSEPEAKRRLALARRILKAGGRKKIDPATLAYVAILKVAQDRVTQALVDCGASRHAAEVIAEQAFVASTPYVPEGPCTIHEALQSLNHTAKEALRLFSVEKSQAFN